MTIAEKPITKDKAARLADIALEICGSLKAAIDDAQWQVPFLAGEQPQRAMALATTLAQTKKRLFATRAAIEQWQRTAQNAPCDQGENRSSAVRAALQDMTRRYMTPSEWERNDLLDRAKNVGIPVPHHLVEPAKVFPPSPPSARLVIHGTDEQRTEALALSALLARMAAEMCLELSCVEVYRDSNSVRSSYNLVLHWLGLASTLLNEMKLIPAAGGMNLGGALSWEETTHLDETRKRWNEFEDKVRWAEREKKNRLKARSIEQ